MKTSFAAAAREELIGLWPERRCCLEAELHALALTLGRVRLAGGGRLSLVLETKQTAVFRKVFRLLRNLYGFSPQMSIRRRCHPGGARAYLVQLPESQSLELLSGAGVVTEGTLRLAGNPAPPMACCRRAYLRGIFIASGSVSHPGRGYHLELVVGSRDQAHGLMDVMGALGLSPRTVGRRDHQVIYLKDGESIGHFLNLVGAHNTLLLFEDSRVRKEVRSRINRLVNADTANLEKTAAAAVRQVENIRFLRDRTQFKGLPLGLRELAELRLLHPELSLKELGARMDPQLSKSAVNHRMRRLEAVAQRLRGVRGPDK